MKKRVIVATIVGVGLVSALVAGKPMMDGEGFGYQEYKQGSHMKHHRKGAKYHHKLFKQIRSELDLTKEQKKQIKRLLSEQKDMMKKERKAMKQKREMPDASKFMTASTFDKEAFKKSMLEQRSKRVMMKKQKSEERLNKRAEVLEKIFAILTPEQRTKLITLSQKKMYSSIALD
ncbi:MAG: Spy/CpxP family protein refolding chaperone [Campylobacterota bacterium]|nr:Spy/CpxP family protein refolding chaperone [Campylobacterota bacterium]